MKETMVSVVMITYNHENYIKQAIEGVLMQKCNFDAELIITLDQLFEKTNNVTNVIINSFKV